VDKKVHKMAVAALIFGALAMNEEPTTVIIQRYLDALLGDTVAEPIVRELLARAWVEKGGAAAPPFSTRLPVARLAS
jgi:hypothetical protein